MDSYRASHSSIAGLIAIAVLSTVGLHSLGGAPGLAIDWHHPLTWIEQADPADTIGASLRYVGLVLGYWVLITTALYYVSGLRQHRRRPRLVTLMTLPPIRRLVDRALATSLVLTIAATPVGSLYAGESVSPEPPPVVFELDGDGIPVPHVGAPVGTGSADGVTSNDEARSVGDQPANETDGHTGSNDGAEPTAPSPVAPPVVVSAPTSTASEGDTDELPETTFAVSPGDNLWTIAAGHLRASTESIPSEREIADYWRAVVAANRGTLRSGDPNLIYPGEIVTLPAPESST